MIACAVWMVVGLQDPLVEAAVTAAEARERALNRYSVTFVALASDHIDQNEFVVARLDFPSEEWSRAMWPSAANKEAREIPKYFLHAKGLDYSIFDGSRTLNIGRDASEEALWTGSLTAGCDRTMRRGPFPGGLVFAEQWLSAQLKVWRVVAVEKEERLTWIEFLIGSTPRFDSVVKIGFDQKSFPWQITWVHRVKGEDKLLYEASVTDQVEVGGVSLPASGMVTYHYGRKQGFATTAQYTELPGTATVGRLDTLPVGIGELGGAVLYRDEVSKIFHSIGDPGRLPIKYRGVPGTLGRFQRESPGSARWWWLAALPVGILLIVATSARRK